MTWLVSFSALVIAIAAALYVIRQRQAVARDEARFELAPTVDHEPGVSEFRRAGAI